MKTICKILTVILILQMFTAVAYATAEPAVKVNITEDGIFISGNAGKAEDYLTVVLYKDRDIVKVYDGIVVDTLPITDRDLLERGIHYENITEADMAAEDYDG